MNVFLETKELENFVASNPYSLAFSFLASRYIETGEIEKAISLAERGMQNFPNYPFGHYVLGLCYYQKGDLAQAQKHLLLSLNKDEKNPRAWKLLGEIHEQLNHKGQAADCFLNYYLQDSFDSDAVAKMQQEEMLQFDQFEREDETGYIETEPLEGEEVTEETTSEEDQSFEKLFEGGELEDEPLDLNEKVEEVFKETLGEMSVETRFDEKERKTEEDEFGNIDLIEFPENKHLEDKEDDEDISAALDEIFSSLEENSGENISSRDDSINETGVSEEALTSEEETSIDESDDELLDFSSIVEDIISEQQEEKLIDTIEKEPSTSEEKTDSEAIQRTPTSPPSTSPTTPPTPEDSFAEGSDDLQIGEPPILSPTLGEIYIAQGRFKEALKVFQQLLEQNPDNHRFQRKVKDIQAMIEKQNQ
ncbi:MAG: tetratricopeptide repeat protein [Calditrichaeota bacterium]|nr:MAG: tetratricopeptide repeat protein [Calditrichota bacterium]